jgi:hypothetical protein
MLIFLHSQVILNVNLTLDVEGHHRLMSPVESPISFSCDNDFVRFSPFTSYSLY